MNDHNRPAGDNLYTLLLFVSVLLTLVLVVLSAYIRLADAGLGCDPWPACYGHLGDETYTARSLADGGPLLPTSLARSFHRLSATLLGLFMVVILVMAVRRRNRPGAPLMAPLLAFAITVGLSVLGYMTPSPLLPVVTVGNVGGGMLMLALLWWTGQRAVPARGPLPPPELRRWARFSAFALVLLFAQILLGAWVSGNLAGPACSGLPGCAGAGDPAGWSRVLELARQLAVDARGRVIADAATPAIHMLHRVGAVLVLLVNGWLAWKIRAAGGPGRSTAQALLVVLGLQIAAGLAAVLSELPLLLVTLHNALAAVTLLLLTNLHHHLTRPPERGA
ncbi:MAG: COX15/CtaA family protein [Gammaproteobacteria bacterium]|jgi:cytochrome c oxidase assembly protein subunit 15|nr:COX15/CtaA family protein [Gammaproteobacteria bacterium]